VVHRRAEGDGVGLTDPRLERVRVPRLVVIGVVRREVVLPEVEQLGGASRTANAVKRATDAESGVAPVSKAADDADDV